MNSSVRRLASRAANSRARASVRSCWKRSRSVISRLISRVVGALDLPYHALVCRCYVGFSRLRLGWLHEPPLVLHRQGKRFPDGTQQRVLLFRWIVVLGPAILCGEEPQGLVADTQRCHEEL